MIPRTRYFHNCIPAILTIIVLILPKLSLSQITFFKTFGDTAETHDDVGHSVLQTEDGGYIVAGEYGRCDVYLVRTDEHGDTLWTKTYGDPEIPEAAYSMDKTDDGGYLISAYIEDPLWRLWLIKTDSQGDSLWTRTYPVRAGFCIKRTKDDGFVITGTGINGWTGIYLLKIDSQGEIQWLKSCTEYGYGRCVQQTSDNGYIVTGLASSSICIIKANADGDTVWTKYYFSEYLNDAYSICETKDGGYFVAGQYTYTEEHGELEAHIWLLRTDSKGDTLWTKKINTGSWEDYVYSCKRTSDNGFIIVGETCYITLNSDIYLLKLDEKGDYQWSSTVGSNLVEKGQFRGYDVEETTDGGYIITGFKSKRYGEYEDLCLLKVDNQGQIVGIDDAKPVIPSAFGLLQNYPNPFNASTTLRYEIPTASRVKITLYDLLGRSVGI